MMRLLRRVLPMIGLLALAAAGVGAAQLGPALQWQVADAAWSRREYDDAAVLSINYAIANPDHDNVIDAWWRAFEIYRAYRPDEARRKECYEKGLAACDRWEKKYAAENKERVAKAMYYHGLLLDRGGQRPLGISILQEAVDKFSGTASDASIRSTLAEWLREANRFQEAIPHYAEYRKLVGVSDWGAWAAFREGWCYQALKDYENMKAVFGTVLDGKYNWGWGSVHWGALDAAKRLQSVGEDQMGRAFLRMIVEKCGSDWDVTKQARQQLGVKELKQIWIHPHYYYQYSTSNRDITGRTQLSLTRLINLLVRIRYQSKEDPFAATLTVVPKVDMAKVPASMTAGDQDGKKSFSAEIADPNEDGNTRGDWWYSFVQDAQDSAPPEGLVVTRTWEKSGNDWGECAIRIQSRDRWNIYIYLPNDKTNVNNVNFQPNQVQDGGKTFLWYQWYDLSQGITIKFPVEVGVNVREFYPRVYLDRGVGVPYGGVNGNDSTAKYETNEFTLFLKSEQVFPFVINCPGGMNVTLNQIMK